MNKTYPANQSTRNLYMMAAIAGLVSGGLLLLMALALLVWVPSGMGYYASRRMLSNVVMVGGLGGVLAWFGWGGLKGAAGMTGCCIELTGEGLVWRRGNTVRKWLWQDVADCWETGTQLMISLKTEEKSVSIPNEYENFEDLVEEVKRRKGRLARSGFAPEQD